MVQSLPLPAQDEKKDPENDVIVEKNVPVPMRDGTILRADVTRPAGKGSFPVLVCRTPYNRDGQTKSAPRYARAGYIVVTQDARGRYASDGQWESFLRPDTRDGEDGADTVEWAARLPGSNGKVGTYGASYDAFLQWRTAAEAPPSLAAMSAHSIPARHTDLEGPGAIRPGRRLQWWFGGMAPDLRRRSGTPGTTTAAEGNKQWDAESEKWLWFLPWMELPRQFFEEETDAVRQWLANPHEDPWKLDEGVPRVTVPADQGPLADRRDILVYQSEPLAERLEVTGHPFVELYASTSAPDTDFFVRLIDVAPDGSNHDVSLGLVRASYRRGFNVVAALREPTPVEPGRVYRYTIRMNPTSIAFLPGHRIRLDVTISDFPNYDRHHNTFANQNLDAELAVATQLVHHGKTHPTRLLLPVIPAK